MQKILLAIDACNLDKDSLDFACYIAKLTGSKITGVFLENIVSHEKPVLPTAYRQSYLDRKLDDQSEVYKKRMQVINRNIDFFKDGCVLRGVTYDIHCGLGTPVQEIIEESKFADILIIDAETSFKKRYEGNPTDFVKNVLKMAACALIVTPEGFETIDEIVFTYSGYGSSMFAIKQFTYLFPQYRSKKITIVHINKKGKWDDDDKNRFSEWANAHYTNIHFEIIKGENDVLLFENLLHRSNIFIVMGAYGRATLANFFKHSKADLLMRILIQPIFIAHL